MIAKLEAAPRVLVAFIALGIIPVLVAGASSLMQASNALHKTATANLMEAKELKKGF